MITAVYLLTTAADGLHRRRRRRRLHRTRLDRSDLHNSRAAHKAPPQTARQAHLAVSAAERALRRWPIHRRRH